jgi:uncharacterized membrane protein YhiD involved in acid resistance
MITWFFAGIALTMGAVVACVLMLIVFWLIAEVVRYCSMRTETHVSADGPARVRPHSPDQSLRPSDCSCKS